MHTAALALLLCAPPADTAAPLPFDAITLERAEQLDGQAVAIAFTVGAPAYTWGEGDAREIRFSLAERPRSCLVSDTYFMWGYEGHFQSGLYIGARTLFQELDPDFNPFLFLVGVLDSGRPKHYPVAVVPQECPYPHTLFEGLKESVERLMKVSPERETFHSSPEVQASHDEAVRREAVWNAVVQTVDVATGQRDVVSFCSWPMHVDGYLVVAVLQLQRTVYDRHYRLHREFVQESESRRMTVKRSLLHATIEQFLEAAQELLKKPSPGSNFSATVDKDQVLREAAKELMFTPAHFGGNRQGLHGLDRACSTLSTLPYEGHEGAGDLVLAPPDHPDIEIELALVSPVHIHNYGAVRKLLQMTSGHTSLLCDSYDVYGLGRVLESYNPVREDLFVIRFVRQFSWELRHDDRVLMHVRYGKPSIRLPGFPEERFRTDLRRVFPSLPHDDAQRLFVLAKGFASQTHGCMLVISSAAGKEAERLASQCTRVKPFRLDNKMLPLVTSIDGAVLVDLECRCHAVGVILDGMASPKCSPSRGSRYNSAVRYVDGQKDRMAVVKSEDGMVSFFPELRPQIRRSTIERKLSELEEMAEAEAVKASDLWYKMQWFQAHAFYLSGGQCLQINSLRREIEARLGEDENRYPYSDFTPDPEMNDSYLTD